MSKKQKTHTSSHSLAHNQNINQGSFSSQNIGKQAFQMHQYDSQIYEFNFKVLSREPTLRNIQKIVFSLNFVNLARYQSNGKYWNYLKVKGPMFLVMDKYSQLKMAILNQCNTENEIIHIDRQMKFQLKNLGKDGFMLNYCIDDSITGTNIYGIWTADKNIQSLWKWLNEYLNKKD